MPVLSLPNPQHSSAVIPSASSSSSSSSGAQSQLICNGCRTLLVYSQGAANVRCALCSTITEVPPAGTEMAQLICGGCHTLLMYTHGATSVRCSCCHTINLAMEANQMEHVTCGGCTTTLMYPSGAPLVKCAVCHFITAIGANSARSRPPQQAPPNTSSSQPASQQPPFRAQTVVVENPMTLDDNGKLVSNVAVGVITSRK